MLGNEGSGLNQNQIALCDSFVYIPQYTDKTASLNVAIAGSLIFHHFALWAGYQEQSREGYKYEVTDDQYSMISKYGKSLDEDPTKKKEERLAKKEETGEEHLGGIADLINE